MFWQKAVVSLSAFSAAACAVPAQPGSLGSRDLSFDYDSQKVRGVCLGGWLVTEPWITPSLFDSCGDGAVDEWTFGQALGSEEAKNRLEQHWRSFITADDFSRIAAAGMNHVRIPIGYWAVTPRPGEPYVQGQLEYLDQAIGWARATGLKVMVDLHGAPGSQNGFDNSGRRGPVEWQSGDTTAQTLQAVQALADRYAGQRDVVTAIELLNEPFPQKGINVAQLQQFYYDGWGNIRQTNGDTTVVIHDAFQGVPFWKGFMSSGFNHVMVDTHHYEIFDNGLLANSIDQHVGSVCSLGKNDLATSDKWTVVGEWTGAYTDCAQYLNGRGNLARYDGTYLSNTALGSCAGLTQGAVVDLPEDTKRNIRRYIEAQLDAYEMRSGWLFWTWKTEGAPEWDMQQLIANGVFPQPLTDRQFPGQCA